MDIAQRELVTQLFGEWPSFHDAEVLSIELRRGKAPGEYADLFASVLVRKYMPVNVGAAQFEMAETHNGVILFRFRGVADVTLGGFNYQNVIDDISMTEEGKTISVVFESIFGVECSFNCVAVSVESVINKRQANASENGENGDRFI